MEEVHDNERRYRFLAERADQIVYDCDLLTGALRWSGDIPGVTGYTVEFTKTRLTYSSKPFP